jgi:hypothetical protein
MPEHPELDVLPEWPTRTIAVLATVDHGPHAIPVSGPLRAGNRRILFSLHRRRGSLARLRRCARVALTILAEGVLAFTARGRVSIVKGSLAPAPDYVAIAIDVERIDDHRQVEFRVQSGIDGRWVDEDEQLALQAPVNALRGSRPARRLPSRAGE